MEKTLRAKNSIVYINTLWKRLCKFHELVVEKLLTGHRNRFSAVQFEMFENIYFKNHVYQFIIILNNIFVRMAQ